MSTIQNIIKQTLLEDLGKKGDITTEAIISKNSESKAVVIAKQKGVICGLDVAREVFKNLDPKIRIILLAKDGEFVQDKTVVMKIEGKTHVILKGERTALNFIQRMSGIATMTSQFVASLKGTKTKILDTRKTVPLFRELDKYAVKCGGGTNHRMGLYDMVLIKDNHIQSAGGITKAVTLAKKKTKVSIEVEIETLLQAQEASQLPIDMIMLDNMSVDTMTQAVKIIRKNNPKIKIEASGNMTLSRIQKVAQTGVDYISAGALTHSVKAFNCSLEINSKS